MKKEFIAGIVLGGIFFGAVGAFAGQYVATENPFPIQLNGNNVSIEGYNIDGSTYFKLRDIASTIGGFEVDFANDTILLSKDGYSYASSGNTGDNSAFYDIVKGDEGTYYILKDNPQFIKNSNIGGKAPIFTYEDTYGNKFVSFSDVSSAANRSGFFCDLFPNKNGTWEFKEWNKSTDHFEYVSDGNIYLDKKMDNFYILLDDYNSKIAPVLEQYIEKYYY